MGFFSSGYKYGQRVDAVWNDIELDPIYEAKCVGHLVPGDLLWIVGHREKTTCK
jgi:hypothetical protein